MVSRTHACVARLPKQYDVFLAPQTNLDTATQFIWKLLHLYPETITELSVRTSKASQLSGFWQLINLKGRLDRSSFALGFNLCN